MTKLSFKAGLLLLPLALAACADGGDRPCPMDGHPHPMHGAWMPKPTGDADVDYVRGMIPHHEMAVKQSEEYLKVGRDAEIRRLAGHIEKSQQHEVAMMQDWLDKRGVAVDDDMNGMQRMDAPSGDMKRPIHWRHDDMHNDMRRPMRDPAPNDMRDMPRPEAQDDMRNPAQDDMRDPRAAASPDVAE